jgi:hypothetical protein
VWYARMRVPMEVREQLAVRFEVLLPHLNERQQRLALAVAARLLGHGGVRAVAWVAGVSETTVRKGVFELEAGEAPFPPGRVRRRGGAARQPPAGPRPRPGPAGAGGAGRARRSDVAAAVDQVAAPTVGRLLREHGFSLQANARSLEGKRHPDRDAWFCYLNEQVKEH